MNEERRKFTPQLEIETVDDESWFKAIDGLYAKANAQEDFNKTILFMDTIADFNNEVLLKSFISEDLIQIPLYHKLIGSGMPEGTVFEVPVVPEIKKRAESSIQNFIIEKLTPLLD